MAKILIVDDHSANRQFLVALLGYRGHEMLEAVDGVDALAEVRAERPELVICDVLMPTMDGFEFVRQLRADPAIAPTPIVFYTAHYHERDARNLAHAMGVSHVVTKPAEPDVVLRVVSEVLEASVPIAIEGKAPAIEAEHLRLVTDKLSDSIENLQVSNQRLTSLIHLNVQLASQVDPIRMLDEVCDGARELLGARYGALGIRSKQSQDTSHFATSGLTIEAAEDFGLPELDRGVLGDVQGRRRSYRSRPPETDPAVLGLPAGFPAVHSFLAAPVGSPAYVYGWICLTDKLDAQEFSAEDEHLLTILAAQAGRIYENGSLYKNVQRHAAALQREIEERKRVQQEVVETRNFLSSIFENIPDAVFVKDAADLRFVRVNAACERLTGYSEHELLGRSDHDFFPEAQADRFVADDREALAHVDRVMASEETITSRDGTRRWVHTKKFAITGADGRPQYLLGMSEDITERKLAEEALQASEAKYRQLIEQASDGIFLSDKEGNFVLMNTRGCQLLGYAPEELLGLNGQVTYVDEEAHVHTQRMLAVVAGEDLRFERMVKRKDGSAFPAEVSLKMLDSGMVQVIFHDISARRSQERKIARLSRIQGVLSGINAAIVRIRNRQELFQEACRIAVEQGGFIIGLIAQLNPTDGKLVAIAQAGLPIDLRFGAPENESAALVPAGAAAVALREKKPAFDNDINRTLEFVAASVDQDTWRVRRAAIAKGAKSVIALPLFVEEKTFGILTLFTPERNFFDDEELKLLQELAGDISFSLDFMAKAERADYLAYYDALTGLPNRGLFFDRMTQQISAASREHAGVALVLIDLDRFRLINDTLGRHAGDVLLESVARRIRGAIRDEDSIARVGSNRFALAVSGIANSAEAAYALETRSEALFGQPFAVGGEELRVLATAGVAMFPSDGTDAETLFANAEAALRKAKQQNLRFMFYSPEMNARVADSLRLENQLRRALDEDELVLWYQPKVNTHTRKLVGFEALMRWQNRDGTMVPPGKFIPVMEQTGLILQAGRWALLQVARDCRAWSAAGAKLPRIAVNVSPIQFRQKDFLATIVEAAEQTEAAGSMLDLEITESVIMENVEAIVPRLQTIRGLGVDIFIDDFGTGYSSLAYIARLPIHALKIDRSFVVGMTTDKDSLSIVRSVISLAHSVRLSVVAEGVETGEQAALLSELDCDEMQGFLLGRPVPPTEVPALIARLASEQMVRMD